MTPEQIAEKMFPFSNRTSTVVEEEIIYQKRNKLISLITTLQKQTWEKACKAQSALDNSLMDMILGVRIEDIKQAPFNPEK